MLRLAMLSLFCGNSSGGLLNYHLLVQRYLALNEFLAINKIYCCYDWSVWWFIFGCWHVYAKQIESEMCLAAYEALVFVLRVLASSFFSQSTHLIEENKKLLLETGGRPLLDSMLESFIHNINNLLAVGFLARTRMAVLLDWKVLISLSLSVFFFNWCNTSGCSLHLWSIYSNDSGRSSIFEFGLINVSNAFACQIVSSDKLKDCNKFIIVTVDVYGIFVVNSCSCSQEWVISWGRPLFLRWQSQMHFQWPCWEVTNKITYIYSCVVFLELYNQLAWGCL